MDNPNLKPLIFLEKTKKTISKIQKFPFKGHITPLGVVFFFMALLCGRATLFSSLRPFGGAFFAALFSRKYGYLYMAGALIGQLTAGSALYEAGKYIFAMTFFALIIEKLPVSTKRQSAVRGGIFSAALALSGTCFMFTSSGGVSYTTLYDSLLLFVECVAAFCATVAFCHAVPIIKRMKLSYTFSTNEEISLVSLLGCVLWGAKDITNIGVVNLANVACILIVIVFSIRLGSARGAIAGLTMGLVSALGSGIVDIGCVSYAFSGLAAGLAGGMGALAGCSAFILSNALITALANGSTEILINIYDILIACVIYSTIPEKIFLRLTSFGARDEKDRVAEDERCYSEYVLMNAQSSVAALSRRMEKIYEKRKENNEAEMKFYERIARRSCSGCGMRRLCWSRDLKKTAASLKNALSHFWETGIIKEDFLPENCLRAKEMKANFSQAAELYRSDIIWQGKIAEVREAAKNQLSAFSEILFATNKTLSESQTFDRALADDIARKMNEENIKCKGVVVMRDSDGDPTVMLSFDNCGGFSLCDKGACEIISNSCGREMIRAGKRDCKHCNIRYVPAPSSRVSFATAFRSRDKKKKSGDIALSRVINKSLYAAVLCDGMGFGEKAALEARSAAETLLDLVETGVSGEKAMEIVNSLLIPYEEQTFSAADLCLFDADTRKAKIIKCGGAASFTKSGERVDALYSKNMPLGSMTKTSVESFTLSTKSGDIIVMISDGVLESSPRDALRDTWLINELENFHGDDPSHLADLIVEKAMEKCAATPRDDITVLTALIN